MPLINPSVKINKQIKYWQEQVKKLIKEGDPKKVEDAIKILSSYKNRSNQHDDEQTVLNQS